MDGGPDIFGKGEVWAIALGLIDELGDIKERNFPNLALPILFTEKEHAFQTQDTTHFMAK